MEYGNNMSQGWGTGTFPYPQMQQNNYNQQMYPHSYQNQPQQANYQQQPPPYNFPGGFQQPQQPLASYPQQQHPPYSFSGGYQQAQQPQVPFPGGYQQAQQPQAPFQNQTYNQQGGFNPQPQQPQAPFQSQTHNIQPQYPQTNTWGQPPPQHQPVGSYPQPPQSSYQQQIPPGSHEGYTNPSLPSQGNQFPNNYSQPPKVDSRGHPQQQQLNCNTYPDTWQPAPPNNQFGGNGQRGVMYQSPPQNPQQNSPPPSYHEVYPNSPPPSCPEACSSPPPSSPNNQFSGDCSQPPKVDPRGQPQHYHQQSEQNTIAFPCSDPFINKQDTSFFGSGTNPHQNFNGSGASKNTFENQTSFANNQKGYNDHNGSSYSRSRDPYVLGKELAEMYVKILFNGKQKSRKSLFDTMFVFGEAVLAVLEDYKKERTSSLDSFNKKEFERRFKDFLGMDVNEMIIKKDKMVIFSNIPKKGDDKHSEIERGDKGIALSEIFVNGRRIAYTTCSEKTCDKSISEKIRGLFWRTVEISPGDIVYVKVNDQNSIERDYVDRKITPLWIRKVDGHGYSYYIVALRNKSIKNGVTGMSDEDILKALTGFETISQTAMSIVEKAPHIDYGQDESMLSKSGLPRCKDFLCCSDTSSRHIKGHLHACKYGDKCLKMGDPSHCKSYGHMPTSCRHGTACTNKSAEHRMLYHGEVKRWCTQNPCREYGKPEHMEEFMHGPRPAKLVSFDGFTTEKGMFPDYDRNMELWMEQTGRYLNDRNIKTTNRYFQQITGWMGNFQPVHQCGKDALNSIAKIGVISSLTRLKSMWMSPDDISHMVWLQREGAEFLSKLTGEGDQEKYRVAKRFVMWYCRFIQATKSPEIAKTLTDKVILGIPIESLKFAIEVFNKVPQLTSKEGKKWEKVDKNASKILGRDDKDLLKRLVESVMGAVQETLENMRALNFGVDQEIGTDRMVFAIHGPNMGKYGGAEVAIVFKPEISRHPDFFMTPVAAIGYHDGWYVENPRVGTDRPWVGDAKSWKRGQNGSAGAGTANEDYERSKFHTTTKGWTEACAMEWISRVVQKSRKSGNPKPPQCVTLEDIQRLWHESDPHTAIEVHLPGLISLDLIDRVYIANSVKSGTGSAESILRGFGVDVEYVDDTRDAVERYMNTPRQNHYQQPRVNERGYEFYVEEGGKECVMPIDIERLCGKCIRFTVVNCESKTSDLMVTFSDMAPSCANESSRECSSFVLRPFNHDGYFIEGLPKNIAKKSTSLVHQMYGFTLSVLEDVVCYTINFDRDSVVLEKFGVSSVFNENIMKIPRKNYRFLSFSSSLFPCYISNVFVADLSSNDSRAYKSVQTMQPVTSLKRTCPDASYKPPRPPKPDSYQSGKHDYDSYSSSSSSFDKSKPSFQDKGHEHLSSPQKSYCSNMYSCPIANNRKDPEYYRHTEQCFHVCRYGQSCRYMDDSFHKNHFHHSKTTLICKYGAGCRDIFNPEHRAKYHHPGYWDWMEVCKYGQSCKKMGDSEHCYNYIHSGKTVYPENK